MGESTREKYPDPSKRINGKVRIKVSKNDYNFIKYWCNTGIYMESDSKKDMDFLTKKLEEVLKRLRE